MRRAMRYPGKGSHGLEGAQNHERHSPLPDAIAAHAISYREPIGMYTLTYWETTGEQNELERTGLAAGRLGKGSKPARGWRPMGAAPGTDRMRGVAVLPGGKCRGLHDTQS